VSIIFGKTHFIKAIIFSHRCFATHLHTLNYVSLRPAVDMFCSC